MLQPRTVAPGIRVFLLFWVGQAVSLVGSGLTSFVLGIWVYHRTGSVMQFALMSLFATLPGLLISPLAGVLVDRWNRRWAMLLSDAGSGLGTLAIAVLLWGDRLQVWHICLAIGVNSVLSAFQWPAYAATTTLLVPQKYLGRASGMVQAAEAFAQLVSPALAGVLMVAIQIQGVLLIDIATFVFSLITLLAIRFPNPKNVVANHGEKGSLRQDAIYGWRYLSARPGLLGLLIFFAINNFLTGVVGVLFTPLVLAFAPVAVLGAVLSTGGSGMLVGSLVMGIWGGAKRRIYAVLSFTLLGGLCILLVGLRPSIPVFFIAAFFYFFGLSIVSASSQAIWQSKVAPAVQGRVFAVRRMVALAALPCAYLVAGPLADQVFEPLLIVGGPLAGSLGRIVGIGAGHGVALLFVVMGVLSVVATVGAYLYPRLRFVEDELRDALIDKEQMSCVRTAKP